jgi:hypothetical protein
MGNYGMFIPGMNMGNGGQMMQGMGRRRNNGGIQQKLRQT